MRHPRKQHSPLHSLLLDTKAATVLEFALVLPFLLAFGLGMIDVGRAMWIQNSLQFAVEDAARCAAINSARCATDADTKTVAADSFRFNGVTTDDFTVSTPSCGKRVAASYNFRPAVPAIVPFTLTLRAQSCHPA